MYPHRRIARRPLSRALLLTLVVLALSACAGGGGEAGSQEQEAKARPLPEQYPQALRPGEYRSEEFKPSFSFRVGKGWSTSEYASDFLQIEWAEKGWLAFVNVQKVYKPIYKPTETSTPKLVEAPEDLVGWFQNHPYLKTTKPEPVTVGGVKGQRFDVVASEVPEDHLSVCGAGCVDAIKGPSAQLVGPLVVFFEGDKVHAIVLEDVRGETVYIDYGGPAPDFDEIAPEAQKVVESVKWGDS